MEAMSLPYPHGNEVVLVFFLGFLLGKIPFKCSFDVICSHGNK